MPALFLASLSLNSVLADDRFSCANKLNEIDTIVFNETTDLEKEFSARDFSGKKGVILDFTVAGELNLNLDIDNNIANSFKKLRLIVLDKDCKKVVTASASTNFSLTHESAEDQVYFLKFIGKKKFLKRRSASNYNLSFDFNFIKNDSGVDGAPSSADDGSNPSFDPSSSGGGDDDTRTAFQKVDTNSDGFLSIREIAMSWHGLAANFFATDKPDFDLNRDGLITGGDFVILFDLAKTNPSGEVFLKCFLAISPVPSLEDSLIIVGAFEKIDTDNNSVLILREFVDAIYKVGENFLKTDVPSADFNSDGLVAGGDIGIIGKLAKLNPYADAFLKQILPTISDKDEVYILVSAFEKIDTDSNQVLTIRELVDAFYKISDNFLSTDAPLADLNSDGLVTGGDFGPLGILRKLNPSAEVFFDTVVLNVENTREKNYTFVSAFEKIDLDADQVMVLNELNTSYLGIRDNLLSRSKLEFDLDDNKIVELADHDIHALLVPISPDAGSFDPSSL